MNFYVSLAALSVQRGKLRGTSLCFSFKEILLQKILLKGILLKMGKRKRPTKLNGCYLEERFLQESIPNDWWLGYRDSNSD